MPDNCTLIFVLNLLKTRLCGNFWARLSLLQMNLLDSTVLSRMMNIFDAILEGLPQEYALVVSVNESKFETPPISEVEALLFAHESYTNRFQKKFFPPPVIYSNSYENPSSARLQVCSNNFCGNFSHSFSDWGARSCGGCGGCFANFQCQICLKYGHTTNISIALIHPIKLKNHLSYMTLQHINHCSFLLISLPNLPNPTFKCY